MPALLRATTGGCPYAHRANPAVHVGTQYLASTSPVLEHPVKPDDDILINPPAPTPPLLGAVFFTSPRDIKQGTPLSDPGRSFSCTSLYFLALEGRGLR